MSFSSGVALGGINNPFSRDNSLSGMDAEKNPRKRAAEDDGGAGSMTKRARQSPPPEESLQSAVVVASTKNENPKAAVRRQPQRLVANAAAAVPGQLKRATEESQRAKDQISAKDSRIAELIASLEQKVHVNRQHEESEQRLKQELEETRQTVGSQQEALKYIQHQITSLQAASQSGNNDDIVANLKEQLGQANHQIIGMTNELQARYIQAEEQKSIIQNLQPIVDNLEKEKLAFQAKSAGEATSLRRLVEEKANEALQATSALAQVKAAAEEELKASRRALGDLPHLLSQLNSTKQVIEQHREEYKKVSNERDFFKQAITEKDDLCQHLAREHDAYKAVAELGCQQCPALAAKIQERDQLLSTAQTEYSLLETQHSGAAQQNEELRATIREKEQALENVEANFSLLQTQLQHRTAEVDTPESASDASHQLATIARLEEKTKVLQAEKMNLEFQVRETESKLWITTTVMENNCHLRQGLQKEKTALEQIIQVTAAEKQRLVKTCDELEIKLSETTSKVNAAAKTPVGGENGFADTEKDVRSTVPAPDRQVFPERDACSTAEAHQQPTVAEKDASSTVVAAKAAGPTPSADHLVARIEQKGREEHAKDVEIVRLKGRVRATMLRERLQAQMAVTDMAAQIAEERRVYVGVLLGLLEREREKAVRQAEKIAVLEERARLAADDAAGACVGRTVARRRRRRRHGIA